MSMSKYPAQVVPTQPYDRDVNGVAVTFGTYSGVPALIWRDAEGHSYFATLSGGGRDPADSAKYGEQLAQGFVFP